MNIEQKFLVNNDCYKQGKIMTPKGIMVHSTGTAGAMTERWYSGWNKSGVAKCVNAFIDDKRIMQTTPWNMATWHSGVGTLGKSKNANNNGYIGFEICEPAGHTYNGGTMVNYDVEKNKDYFNTVYQSAVELCAFLCKEYNIKPEKPYLICHREGYDLGIASGHADVLQWFPKHGKSMDDFRADIKKLIEEQEKPIEQKEDEEEMRYYYLKDVPAIYRKEGIDYLVEKGIIKGKSGSGENRVIDLGEDTIRLIVYNYRAGIYNNIK